MIRVQVTLALLVVSVVACAEGATSDSSSRGTAGAGGAAGTGGAAGVGGGGGLDDAATTSDAGSASVVIDEISAAGDDWVELFNRTGTEVDLSGFSLTDTDADAGAPSPSDALAFETGTKLAAGEHVLVLAKQTDAAGASTVCGDAGVTRCWHVAWGISASKGEGVYLLDRSGHVASAVEYPADAAPAGETWCAIPDGTDHFVACAPTPGAANRAP